MLILRIFAIAGLFVASCLPAKPPMMFKPTREFKYISIDLSRALVFTREGARFGDLLALSRGIWPTHPVEMVPTASGAECISIGPAGSSSTVQMAVRRPLRINDRYTCLRSSFRVIRCFQGCRAAVIEVLSAGGGNNPRHDPLKSYLFVDSCRGLVAYSGTGSGSVNLARGMPLNAMLLRGDVGVLANPRYPECDK